MSRSYDTGLAAPQRTLVQAKFIEYLQPLKRQSLGGTDPKGFCQAIIPISFRVDAAHEDTVDLLEKALQGRSPAIAVAVLDWHGQQAGGPGQSNGDLECQLYFYTSHMRDATDGRAVGDVVSNADDTADPGVYTMLELAWMHLYDRPFNIPTVHEPKLRGEFEVITSDRHTLWRQEWRVLVERNANLYRGLTQLFTNAVTELNPTDDQPDSKNIIVNTTVG